MRRSLVSIVAAMLTAGGCGGGSTPSSPSAAETPVSSPLGSWSGSINDPVSGNVVGTFLTRVDVDLAIGALQAAGIPAMVSADDAAGLRPHLWMGGVRVLVATSDVERARDVLATTAEGDAKDSQDE